MDWFAWNLAPFYVGVLIAVSLFYWSYRVWIDQHPIATPPDFTKPIRWLLLLIAVTVIRMRAYAIALGFVLVGLTQLNHYQLSYILWGILTLALISYVFSERYDYLRWHNRNTMR